MKKTSLLLSFFMLSQIVMQAQNITVSPSVVTKNNQRVIFTFSSGSNAVFYQGSPTQGTSTIYQGTPTMGSSTIRYIPSSVAFYFYQASSTQGSNTQGSGTQGTNTQGTSTAIEQFLNPVYTSFVNSHTIQAAFDITTYLPNGSWDVIFGCSTQKTSQTFINVSNNGVPQYLEYNYYYQDNSLSILDQNDVNSTIFENPKTEQNITIYPVPFTNELNVKFDESISNVHYQVLSVNGQIMKSGELFYSHSSLDLSDLPSGIYFVKLFDSNEILKTTKILKQ